jgi:UDP:flavonoid glycosyltransferase YjiC (YdhE family)
MLVFYVTGHGYGHATRAAALAEALLRFRPSLKLMIRSQAPSWIFRETAPGVDFSLGGGDTGMVQKDAFTIDLDASLELQRAFGRRWPAAVSEEAAWLKAGGARLVVGDIPPLAFAAAAEAGVPSIGVANFCWDWIFEPYEKIDLRWAAERRRVARAYQGAELAFRLPLHGDFPSFREVVDAPLLCRRSHGTRAGWLASRGMAGDGRPIVLAAFGGFAVELAAEAGEILRGLIFAGFGPKPKGLSADWVELAGDTSRDQLDAIGACDVVFTKPGYGILSESMAHGKRVLYVPRTGFREVPALIAGIEARGACAPLPPEDFAAGRWKDALLGLLARPAPAPVAADGAEFIARRLLERLDAS